LFLKILRMR